MSVFTDLLKSDAILDVSPRPFPRLPINEVMRDFIISVKRYILDGVTDTRLFNLKLLELYILFSSYYTKSECVDLFHPILKKNLKFRTFVLDNYSVSMSIGELSKKANMSRSTFDRKFKESFGMTPLKWTEMQTRMLIMRKAAEPNVTVKDMMFEIGMHNPSQFTQLCKRLLGQSPSNLIK